MKKRLTLIILFSSALMYWIGFSMVRPIVSLYFNSQGYSIAAIGWLMALYAVVPVLFAMPVGSIIDRIGTRHATWIGSLILMGSGLLYWLGGMWGVLLPILMGQLLCGLGSLLSWGALQTAAAQSARRMGEDIKKDHMLANFAFVNSLVQFAGPIAGGYISDVAGYEAVFLLFSGLAGVSVCLAFLLPKVSQKETEGKKEFNLNILKSYANGYQLMRENRPFAMAILVNGILFILIDMKGTFFPLYLADIGLSNTRIGLILSVGAIAAVIIRPLTGFVIRWLGHEQIVKYTLVIGACCMISLVFEPSIWVISIIIFIWGICAGVNQPMALIMVARTVASSKQGMAMSLRTMSNRVVQVGNPIMFGALSGFLGLTFGFGAIGVMLLGGAMVIHRMYRNEANTLTQADKQSQGEVE